MNIKLALLLFAVFATSQTARIYHSPLKGDWVVDELANLLEYIGRAVNALNIKLKEIDFSDDGLIKLLQTVAINANNKLLNLLDTIRTNTDDTGKVIIDCFEAQSTLVEADLNETAKEIGQCAKLGMSGVKWYMDEYIDGMDWITNNLNTYAADLRECDNESAIPCITQVMEKNNLTLPVLVAFAGGRVIEIAIGVVGGIAVAKELHTCGENVIEEHIDTYSEQVFNAAVKCIEQKLNP